MKILPYAMQVIGEHIAILKRVMEVLDLVGSNWVARRMVSRWGQQRIAIARAIVSNQKS